MIRILLVLNKFQVPDLSDYFFFSCRILTVLYLTFFQPPHGLLSLLDRDCKSLQNTDADFVKKCDSLNKKHPNYFSAKLSYPAFTIRHFSGKVSQIPVGRRVVLS